MPCPRDAARLAVTAGRLTAPALRVFSLATGHERVWDGPWVGPGYGPGAAYSSLSWDAAGQTLALITSGTGPDSGVRLLDATAPSRRLVLASPTGPEYWSGNYWRQVIMSADGQAIIAVLQLDGRLGSADRVTQKLVTFSAGTGELLHTLNHIPSGAGPDRPLCAQLASWPGSCSAS